MAVNTPVTGIGTIKKLNVTQTNNSKKGNYFKNIFIKNKRNALAP